MSLAGVSEQSLAAVRATTAIFLSALPRPTKLALSTVRPRRLLDIVPPLLRDRRRIHPRQLQHESLQVPVIIGLDRLGLGLP